MHTINYQLKKTIHLPNISQFFFSLFIINILVDPANGMFHTKQITFFLALITNIQNFNFKFKDLMGCIFIYIAFFVSEFLMIGRNIWYDSGFTNTYMTTFLTLLILFIDKDKINNSMNVVYISAILISITTIIISVIMIVFPISFLFFGSNEFLNSAFKIHDEKDILFFKSIMVFHHSSPFLIIPYSLALYDFLRNKKISTLLVCILIGVAILFTGTRANIFSLLLMPVFVYLDYTYFYRKKSIKFVLLTILFLAIGLLGTYLLLTIKNESSVAKDGHVESYIELFDNDFLAFLLGTGPGSYFYTKGFGEYVTNTEITYLELIRMFGFFFSIGIMLFYLSPFLFVKKIGNNRNLVICMSYIAYLFIAGTNPYLIGPTGFVVLWMINFLLYKENKKIYKNNFYSLDAYKILKQDFL